ncbi:MAG: TonB family protein [Bacteroidales bacterium]|nr:TonB family protein [Bacteroidales bacterium]
MHIRIIYIAIISILYLTLNIKGQSIEVIYIKGLNLYNEGKYELAIEKFDEVISIDPKCSSAYFKRSYCYYNRKNYNQALKDIEKAYDGYMLDNRYFFMKTQFHDKLKHYNLAQYYLDMAINFEREKIYYYKYRGGLKMELQKYKSAINDYNYILSRNPDIYNVYYQRGLAKYNLKRREKACLDWLYAREKNNNCNRYFFYKCTDLDLRGKNIEKLYPAKIDKPVFESLKDLSLSKYIGNNLEYPYGALHNEIEGTVIVQFTISTEAKITDIEILHSVSNKVDNEVIRVIKSSAALWQKPAYKNGNPTNYKYVIPVSFRINNNTSGKSVLIDSLNILFTNKKYDDVIRLANVILNLNPFNIEVYQKQKIALNGKENDKTKYNISFYNALRYNKAEFLDEIQPSRKYVKFYFNDLWQITDAKNAEYYRICEWDNELRYTIGKYQDYTIDGKIFSKGEYINKYKHGIFQFYYPGGKIKAEVKYLKNKPFNLWKYYYPNGKISQIIEINGDSFEVLEYNDSSGKSRFIEGTGKWEMVFLNYTKTDTIKIIGSLKNYQKNGIWELFISDTLVVEEKYNKGKFTSCIFYENGYIIKHKRKYIGTWLLVPIPLTRTKKLKFDPTIDKQQYSYLIGSKF